jgi:hypothetical protein
MPRGLRRKLNPFIEPDFVAERVKKMKAGIGAQVEPPFGVIQQQFGFTNAPLRHAPIAPDNRRSALLAVWFAFLSA